MIESYPMDLRRNYLPAEPPGGYNVNALAPLGRAIEVWNERRGREKIGRLVPFARKAIADGNNDVLQHLLKMARSDPHVSNFIPEDFDLETHSPGHLRVSTPLDDDQLTALFQHSGDVYVRREIGEAAPGRYAYTMQDGLLTGFEAVGKDNRGMAAPMSLSSPPATTGGESPRQPGQQFAQNVQDYGIGPGDIRMPGDPNPNGNDRVDVDLVRGIAKIILEHGIDFLLGRKIRPIEIDTLDPEIYNKRKVY
jgi:hypothetical protein